MLLRSIVIIFCSLASPFALAGHERGNTADYGRPESGAAWFLDKDRVVSYCIDVHEEAAINVAQVDGAVQDAVRLWRGYATTRKVHHDLKPHLQFTFNFKKAAECGEGVDLRFLIGHPKQHELIAPILEHQDHWNPLGLAYRDTYDLYRGWSKGFVWIAPGGSIFSGRFFPDWNVNNALLGVLLHEFGHIFGTGHVRNTIMDNEDLHVRLVEATFGTGAEQLEASQQLGKIDGSREVYSSGYEDLTIPGVMHQIDLYRERAELVFRDIMGRSAVGGLTVELRRKEWEFSLEMGDAENKRVFPIKRLQQDGGYSPVFFDSIEVFKVYGPSMIGGASLYGTEKSSTGLTTLGSLTTASGETVIVVIKHAMDSTKWQVDFIHNGIVRPVFYSHE